MNGPTTNGREGNNVYKEIKQMFGVNQRESLSKKTKKTIFIQFQGHQVKSRRMSGCHILPSHLPQMHCDTVHCPSIIQLIPQTSASSVHHITLWQQFKYEIPRAGRGEQLWRLGTKKVKLSAAGDSTAKDCGGVLAGTCYSPGI